MVDVVARAVFLDRDGVINELVPRPPHGHGESPLRTEDVRLVEGVPSALRRLRRDGYLLACVTNQPSAAKGLSSVDEINGVHLRVLELLDDEGVSIDAERICLHHPDASDPVLLGPCRCRKPEPGMVFDIAAELDVELSQSWIVGDTEADMLAGRRAGLRSILIENPMSSHKRCGSLDAYASVADLGEAASVLLAAPPPGSLNRCRVLGGSGDDRT